METKTSTPDIAADLCAELAADGVPAVLTLREAAKVSRIHYQTAWEKTQTGEFPAFRRGGRWLVQRSELARWLLQEDF